MDTHRLFRAALELQTALNEVGRPYCFIGGLAVQRWGEVRFTQDADATVLGDFQFDEEIIERLFARFKSRRPDGPAVARQYRVLLLETADGVRIDVALGAMDFEARATQRASLWQLPDGRSLRTCSAEDLIVHKAFASRDKDWMDINGILMRQGTKLNVSQIFDELRPLVALKGDDAILPRLEILMRRHGIMT